MTTVDIHMGDVVRLRKPHPCGGYEWRVMRVGADIGLSARAAVAWSCCRAASSSGGSSRLSRAGRRIVKRHSHKTQTL